MNKKNIKYFFRKIFELFQNINLDILPHHFYSEIPHIKTLKRTSRWKEPYRMIGVNGMNNHEQLDFMQSCCPENVIETIKSKNIHLLAGQQNSEIGYGRIEADYLYAFIVSKQPKNIVQIGCGVSTAIILEASKDANYRPEITCIDPYPTDYLKKLEGLGAINLIAKPVQEIDSCQLVGSDIDFFFVDSTHTVSPGSDVNFVILEILQELPGDCWVHFHDIYFPYDYQRGILNSELFFQNESVLLHAFLVGNDSFEVKCSLSFLHYSNPKEMMQILPNYQPAENDFGLEIDPEKGHFPSALYLKKIK